jgi:imidazole glycerol-phosphate synthase
MKVSILDYGAGNVRSVRNAIIASGYTHLEDITTPEQILNAECIIFPGVGSYQTAMNVLNEKQYIEPLKEYLRNMDRPFLGICLGMQTLFDSSEEVGNHHTGTIDQQQVQNGHDDITTTANNPKTTVPGLGIIPGRVIKFDETKCIVPHIGWNGRIVHQNSPVLSDINNDTETYFVHSYYAEMNPENENWILTSTTYGNTHFISSIQNKCIVATQFHPEKSGIVGLQILKGFLDAAKNGALSMTQPIMKTSNELEASTKVNTTHLTKRIVVALDVRTNDDGDLVVTKGDQYDVREKKTIDNTTTNTTEEVRGSVRNLGKPVSLAQRYYDEGADEIAFLNITSFRQGVIEDMPMLHVLEEASKNIFVPLTVGGGIRQYTDPTTNQTWTAVEVASRYFRAGADKVSLGSDAVYAAEEYVQAGSMKTGKTSIEMISNIYGVQAVVVSIDPKRIYVAHPVDVTNKRHVVLALNDTGNNNNMIGPNGELYCWYQCTVNGGRELRDICAVTLAQICEQLGAGEIMLNCIDMDGQGNGYDHVLLNAVSNVVTIPVIASSGAGTSQHFVDVFTKTNVQAALAAGMFHRKEVDIEVVKDHMRQNNIPARRR